MSLNIFIFLNNVYVNVQQIIILTLPSTVNLVHQIVNLVIMILHAFYVQIITFYFKVVAFWILLARVKLVFIMMKKLINACHVLIIVHLVTKIFATYAIMQQFWTMANVLINVHHKKYNNNKFILIISPEQTQLTEYANGKTHYVTTIL